MQSIFTKKPNTTKNVIVDDLGNNNSEHVILSLDDIKRSIPEESFKIPRPDLLKTHTEWRWRFFNIEGRQLIEISKLEPNNERVYVDNTSKWTKCTLDASWEKYIVNERYCYVK